MEAYRDSHSPPRRIPSNAGVLLRFSARGVVFYQSDVAQLAQVHVPRVELEDKDSLQLPDLQENGQIGQEQREEDGDRSGGQFAVE
jgi:hypothetical protein